MAIYINKMEMPLDVPGNELIIRIQPNGDVLDQYGHYLALHATFVPPIEKLRDTEILNRIEKITRRLIIISDGGDAIPRKSTTRRECYRALYEIKKLLKTRDYI